MKDNQKHLTLSERIIIEQGLNEGKTFTAIAEGINQSPENMQKLDQLVSPLILKGQSLAHIYANHATDTKSYNCTRANIKSIICCCR